MYVFINFFNLQNIGSIKKILAVSLHSPEGLSRRASHAMTTMCRPSTSYAASAAGAARTFARRRPEHRPVRRKLYLGTCIIGHCYCTFAPGISGCKTRRFRNKSYFFNFQLPTRVKRFSPSRDCIIKYIIIVYSAVIR